MPTEHKEIYQASPPVLRYNERRQGTAKPNYAHSIHTWGCKDCPCSKRIAQVEARVDKVNDSILKIMGSIESLWKAQVVEREYAEARYRHLKEQTDDLTFAIGEMDQNIQYITFNIHKQHPRAPDPAPKL